MNDHSTSSEATPSPCAGGPTRVGYEGGGGMTTPWRELDAASKGDPVRVAEFKAAMEAEIDLHAEVRDLRRVYLAACALQRAMCRVEFRDEQIEPWTREWLELREAINEAKGWEAQAASDDGSLLSVDDLGRSRTATQPEAAPNE